MRVVVTGGKGFLGRHVGEILVTRSASVRLLGSADGDLRDELTARHLLRHADVIIHLAADVGGVGYLRTRSAEVFHSNLSMGLNVIEAARAGSARRLVMAGTPCSYAAGAELPLRESALLSGVPSGDTGTYAYAKLTASLAAAVAGRAAGMDVVTVIPSNLYGPGDCFTMDRAHVVAALVRKALLAAATEQRFFDVWGDGSASRDLVYVGDVAAAIATAALAEDRFEGDTFNLGSGRETTIAELAHTIATVVGRGVTPRFLPDKPVGYQRRALAYDRAAKSLAFQPSTGLREGLSETIQWVRRAGLVSSWIRKESMSTGGSRAA